MTILFLILAVVVSQILAFAASLVGGVVSFFFVLMFHTIKASIRGAVSAFCRPKMSQKV